MRTARLMTVGGILGVATLFGAAPAAAIPPNAVEYEVTFAAGQFCPFVVTALVTDNQNYVRTTLDDGSTRVTYRGAAFVTLQGNGKSIDLNVSGPGEYLLRPDGSLQSGHASGRNFFQTSLANSAPGVPPLHFTRGRVSFEVAPSGVTTAFELRGQSTDICAVLS